MEEDLFNVPLSEIKRELRRGIIECQKRCLMHSAKWLSEMSHGLGDIDCGAAGSAATNNCSNLVGSGGSGSLPKTGDGVSAATMEDGSSGRRSETVACQFLEGIAPNEFDNYFLAKSYFHLREYDRAAYFVRNCESSVPRFLHLYATYMAREKRRLDSTTDQSNLNDSGHVRDLAELLSTLRAEYSRGQLDGYGMYLYGVVLKALNLKQVAVQVFSHAIRQAPMLWAAYVELAPLITEKEKLMSLQFGGHWMRHIFVAHTYLELYMNDEGLKGYEELQNAGFRKCVYVTSQMALAYHNKRDVDKAIEIFQTLQEADPYRLDNIDTFSNLLFVKELKTEMAQLAHKAVGINKYSPETCCVIGNYYSIRCDHQMAITYFQRALKLNPKYLSAWTLMGHEFMELKNTNAAIQSYRKAVEVNKRDYRAWYGLGQSYEILKMHYYSLYYFKIAHQLRPFDSRMLVALGETYEKLDKFDNAIKCYWKACDVGDIEGVAMYKLATLHERLGEHENAMQCYVLYCEDERAGADKTNLYTAYMKLANHYDGKAQYDRASHYAFKCLESDERKIEAKALLKTIENKRSGKISTSEAVGAAAAANLAASADTSSDDEDMDLELSDYKYMANDYMLSCRSSMKSTAIEAESEKTPTGQTGGLAARQQRSASTTAAAATSASEVEMSLSESDMMLSTSTSAAAAAAAGSSSALVAPASSRTTTAVPAVAIGVAAGTVADDANDDESQSMEISSISID